MRRRQGRPPCPRHRGWRSRPALPPSRARNSDQPLRPSHWPHVALEAFAVGNAPAGAVGVEELLQHLRRRHLLDVAAACGSWPSATCRGPARYGTRTRRSRAGQARGRARHRRCGAGFRSAASRRCRGTRRSASAISPSCPRPSPTILLKFGLGKCFAIIPTAVPPMGRKAMPTGFPGRLSSTCKRETV